MIEPNVKFWIDVFTKYSYRDLILFDSRDVSRTYHVYHIPGSGPPSRTQRKRARTYLTKRYRSVLKRLGSGRSPATALERRVAALFGNGSPRIYREAADSLRIQQGMHESFRKTLRRGRWYRPRMEKILRAAGLPVELFSLAAVESGFHNSARSRAGAVGIWQFTRGTGRKFMRISRYRDDRLDPIRSTHAAAKLLKSNYELFGNWPLAITAYNYGTAGTARAARAYGNDYEKILSLHDGRRFGFAVKNYYSEFLAALEIYRDPERYFPGISREPVIRPPSNYRIRPGDTIYRIARRYGVSEKSLMRANGVHDPRRLRPGRTLIIPRAYAMAGRAPARGSRPSRSRYRVRRGDTIHRIARRYGVSAKRLMEANRVNNPRRLMPGTTLIIPAT